jgi:hypothetical protein
MWRDFVIPQRERTTQKACHYPMISFGLKMHPEVLRVEIRWS